MNDYHCLEIEFKEASIKSDVETNNIFHAHLYPNKEEIELKIFYEDDRYLVNKLMNWFNKFYWQKFGDFIKVKLTPNYTNDRIQKIDLSNSKLFNISSSTNYYENNKKYIVLKIDTVKFYWDSNKERENNAEFYLDQKGFRVVKSFYGLFGPKSFYDNDGEFDIKRMEDSTKFYAIGKSQFRPEFNFYSKDNRDTITATITKEPKFQFIYENGTTEQEAIRYGDSVLMLASFYHHIKIDFTLRRIHLPQNTIVIKNIEQKNYFDTYGNLRAFNIQCNFNKFLEKNWQQKTLKNFNLLSKAVKLFNQSHLLDNSSAFLIRYNIIEILDTQKLRNEKFTLILNKNKTKAKNEEILLNLLDTIKIDEHEEFKKRWQNVQSLLYKKPMKNQLITFLESQGLDPKIFPIEIKEIIALRNNIIHGSIDKVNNEKLRKANILLYRITGILILNLMGIYSWKLDLKII